MATSPQIVEPAIKGVMSLDELKATPIFINLTPARQTLIDTYITTGNRLAAVQAAYHPEKLTTARVMTTTIFASASIEEVLDVYLGTSEFEKISRQIDRALRRRHRLTCAEIDALRMKAELAGLPSLANKLPAKNGYTPIAERPKFKVGDIITQDGKDHLATRVSADGSEVLAAKELR